MLCGGFEKGIITQIYGGSGTGKTNICIQTAIECVKQNYKVIYIDTEGFSGDRFKQIAGKDAKKIASDILIYEPANMEQQYSAILDTGKLINENIGLIVLDSAALYYRLGLNSDDSNDENILIRRELINQIGLLHGFARKYNVAVIITNQIYTDVSTGEMRPIGGNALEHLSKTIIFIEKIGISIRKAVIMKHRSKPEGVWCNFKLTEKGVE